MCKTLVLAGLLTVAGVQAVSAEGYRNSDGSYGALSGNSIYNSDSSCSNKVGNTYYHSDGIFTTVDE